MANQKAKKKKAQAKSKGMDQKSATEFVDALSSKHASLQPILRKFVAGQKVTANELQAAADEDSRAGGVVGVLRLVNERAPKQQVAAAISELDSFGEPLRPLLVGLAEGLS